ncbi:glycolipid transfer protein A [Leptopilina heterotoma]|uniref:glycolipid transfer protein A n=1 Tax=Leptopilina heterotoma TaxID=63436 RepID=UPI001CA8D690|nr:glycolipid transfer protein A [Leptopilina heterotoma]
MSLGIAKHRFRELNQDCVIFPKIIEGKINTEQFLDASQQLVQLINKFGKLFAPMKYDMQQNIDKLNAKFNNDRDNHSTLQDMILIEKTTGNNTIAIEALLWLRRGMYMIQLFFEKIVQDHKSGQATEDLVACLKKSYKESLEPYHGWMAQQLFTLLARMVPTRTQLLQILTNGHEDKENEVLQNIDELCKGLKVIVLYLQEFYILNHLNNT